MSLRRHFCAGGALVTGIYNTRMTSVVADHFVKAEPAVRATYRRLIETAGSYGPVSEDPKKTSIHLVRRTAFAGVAVRRAAIILTLKSDRDIKNARIVKREQTSANRWHVEVRLERPEQIDRDVATWLKAAYELSG